MHKGFTLIEMAVVLLIVGLLAGSVLVGQSVIRNSQLQSIIKDVAMYQNSIAQFKQKYNALPGDMPGATNYWGSGTVSGGCNTGTCNGNGDGQITLSTASPYEQFLVWQHLALGAFIPASYSGTAVSGASSPTIYCGIKVNCPTGKVNGIGYFIQYSPGPLTGSTTNYWAQGPGHYLIVGQAPKVSSYYPAMPLVSASEALSLDSKIDDGLPGQGLWKSFEATGNAGYLPNCVVQSGTTNAPADGTIASEAIAVYNVSYGKALACSFEILMSF